MQSGAVTLKSPNDSARARFLTERLKRLNIPALQAFAQEYLPLDKCEQFGIVPLGIGGQFCTIGACNPKMVGLWDCVDHLERSGFIVRLERIPVDVYETVIHQLRQPWQSQDSDSGRGGGQLSSAIISSDNLLALSEELQTTAAASDEEQVDENAPIVRLIRNLIEEAILRGVSDIHIEPQSDSCRIRLRKDGMLHTVSTLPLAGLAPLIARVKVMSRLNIAERRLPQDGALRVEVNGNRYDIRVSTLPGRLGEKAVLRILASSNISLKLDDLIGETREREMLRRIANKPYGILVVSGPTGSGKTTTLYSLLRERNDPSINILTVEDPVEITLPGIHQVQVIREKGYDFARALRAFMRQDPDVILVGETRDPETAKTAVEASLTGHLVLTTLHANDAFTSIPRLTEMGVEPYLMASSLLGVCAQRLVRRVCPDCSDWMDYPPDLTRVIGLSGGGRFRRARELKGPELQNANLSGTLCPTCGGLGYVGRLGLYEVVEVDDPMRMMITAGARKEELMAYARETQGFRTLLEYASLLLEQGLTTVEEVMRVCLSQ